MQLSLHTIVSERTIYGALNALRYKLQMPASLAAVQCPSCNLRAGVRMQIACSSKFSPLQGSALQMVCFQQGAPISGGYQTRFSRRS